MSCTAFNAALTAVKNTLVNTSWENGETTPEALFTSYITILYDFLADSSPPSNYCDTTYTTSYAQTLCTTITEPKSHASSKSSTSSEVIAIAQAQAKTYFEALLTTSEFKLLRALCPTQGGHCLPGSNTDDIVCGYIMYPDQYPIWSGGLHYFWQTLISSSIP